jgi:hypothetical protein
MNTSKRKLFGFGYQIIEERRPLRSRYTPQRVLWVLGFGITWPIFDPVSTIEAAREVIERDELGRRPSTYHVHRYEPRGQASSRPA